MNENLPLPATTREQEAYERGFKDGCLLMAQEANRDLLQKAMAAPTVTVGYPLPQKPEYFCQ